MSNSVIRFDFSSSARFSSSLVVDNKRRAPVFFMTVMLLLILSGWQHQAQAQDLDTAFGTGGRATTPMGGGSAEINDLLLQPDGKIVAIGSYGSWAQFGVVRYNSDGNLDASFGTGGIVTTNTTPLAERALAGALQPDGKIVVAGWGNSFDGQINFTVVRYNTDGSLDASFGTGGIVTTDFGFGNHDLATDVVVQPDGKIVVVGYSYYINQEQYYDFSLARYNPNGSLDGTFGTGGKQNTNFGYHDQAHAVLLLPDGKLIVGGYSRNVGTLDDYTLARYNTNGSLDTSFGVSGRAIVDNSCCDNLYDLELQPDGKILAVGGGFTVFRFNPDGSLDGNFGTGGLVQVTFPGVGGDRSNDLALQPDGKIVVVGSISTLSGSDFGLVRLNPNGSYDTTFDVDGRLVTNFFTSPTVRSSEYANAVVIQPDGKILAGGSINNNSASSGEPNKFALARYLPNPRHIAIQKLYDFDGDGRADIGVFRPANATWYIFSSATSSQYSAQWVQPGDIPEPADFDGDSRMDFVTFRPSTGMWSVRNSFGQQTFVLFGQNGDIPVAADYNGDFKADYAVFRPSTGYWYIQYEAYLGNVDSIQFGANGDKPVPADYNGDGITEIAVWRPSNGTWYTSTNPATNYDAFAWGQNGDIPVPGDYDGDGKSDHAIFRPSTATWWILYSGGGYLEQQFGISTDQPVPADYDGDGKTNIAVFRPSTGYWYTSTNPAINYGAQLWGQSGDIAVESSNVP